LGTDAVVTGGIEVNTDIPEGMEFIPSSVPDGEFEMRVFASVSGEYYCSKQSQFTMLIRSL
jgi:hypothetical protein